jgi:hypothetical protein
VFSHTAITGEALGKAGKRPPVPEETTMTTLYCACCGRPFVRTSARGPAPFYCSQDCRLQMAIRRRAWNSRMDSDRTATRRTVERYEVEHADPPSFGRITTTAAGQRTAAFWR